MTDADPPVPEEIAEHTVWRPGTSADEVPFGDDLDAVLEGAGLGCSGIYWSPCALVVDLRSQIDEGEEPAAFYADHERRRALADLLRLATDCAWNLGARSPVVGLLRVADAEHEDAQRLAGDQDWHRGDFALVVRVEQEGGDARTHWDLLRDELLGPNSADVVVPKIEPMGVGAYAATLRAARSRENLSAEHAGLVDRVAASADRVGDATQGVRAWADDVLARAAELRAQSAKPATSRAKTGSTAKKKASRTRGRKKSPQAAVEGEDAAPSKRKARAKKTSKSPKSPKSPKSSKSATSRRRGRS